MKKLIENTSIKSKDHLEMVRELEYAGWRILRDLKYIKKCEVSKEELLERLEQYEKETEEIIDQYDWQNFENVDYSIYIRRQKTIDKQELKTKKANKTD